MSRPDRSLEPALTPQTCQHGGGATIAWAPDSRSVARELLCPTAQAWGDSHASVMS